MAPGVKGNRSALPATRAAGVPLTRATASAPALKSRPQSRDPGRISLAAGPDCIRRYTRSPPRSGSANPGSFRGRRWYDMNGRHPPHAPPMRPRTHPPSSRPASAREMPLLPASQTRPAAQADTADAGPRVARSHAVLAAISAPSEDTIWRSSEYAFQGFASAAKASKNGESRRRWRSDCPAVGGPAVVREGRLRQAKYPATDVVNARRSLPPASQCSCPKSITTSCRCQRQGRN